MKRTRIVIVAIAAASAVALPMGSAVLPASAMTLPGFTTSPKHAPDPHPHRLTQLWKVRPANDGAFDRIVFDERFSPSGYTVRYVKHVIADGSGKRVHVKGKFFLSLSIPNISTGGAAGHPTFVHKVMTPDLPEVVQIKKTGEFEDVVSFGIGLRHRNGFRVFVLHSPLRLVIDVAH
jgi:hypothetical protein